MTEWTMLEKVLCVLCVIVAMCSMFVGMLILGLNGEITDMNDRLANYGKIAADLHTKHSLDFNVMCEYSDDKSVTMYSDIPVDYILVCVEDTRYHIRGFLGVPCLFIDGALVANGWNSVNCELTLLRSRLDCNL
jgi:hypothetical protein